MFRLLTAHDIEAYIVDGRWAGDRLVARQL